MDVSMRARLAGSGTADALTVVVPENPSDGCPALIEPVNTFSIANVPATLARAVRGAFPERLIV